MKFLKKASLAASIAAVSFAANAELVAMDEAMMSATTGQAGVDITVTLEGSSAVSIGGILYRDTDTMGGVLVDGVTLGAADGGTVTLYNKVDITADGDITIDHNNPDGTQNVQNLVLSVGEVSTVTSAYVSGPADGANLVGASTIYMTLGSGTTTIAQDDVSGNTTITMAGGTLEVTSDGVNDTNVSLLNNAIGLNGLRVYGSGGVGTGMTTDATLEFSSAGVSITNVDLAGTIEVQDLTLGASSIGSLAISDIALNGAAITISGH